MNTKTTFHTIVATLMLLSQVLWAQPSPAAAQIGSVKLVRTTLKETVDDKHIEINMTYPQVVSPTAKLEGFNALAKKQVDDIVANFKTETEPPPADLSTMTSTLESNYQLLHLRKGLLSIRSTVYFYNAGAAHPNTYSTVINYDVTEGKALDLADLFKPDATYLDVLATYCKATLKRRGRLDFPEGADPKLENYDAWNFTARGLLINFDPYQVTPYAAGPQQCLVPIAVLAKSLKDPARLR